MSRQQILAEVLAHLEAERFAPRPPRPTPPKLAEYAPRTLDEEFERASESISDERATANRRRLDESISEDSVVIAWRERKAG